MVPWLYLEAIPGGRGWHNSRIVALKRPTIHVRSPPLSTKAGIDTDYYHRPMKMALLQDWQFCFGQQPISSDTTINC
jgi:hypothetical protein